MSYTIVRAIGDQGCTVTETYRNREWNASLGDYVYSGLEEACYACPAVAAQPAVEPQTVVDPQYGWNSSAYSRTAHAGDCYVEYTAPFATGVVCGLAPERRSNHPRDIPHGFYCYKDGGRNMWAVIEAGVTKTTPAVRAAEIDVFRIERRRGGVRYFLNGAQVYASETPATTSLVVVACMYAAGDGVY